MASAENVPGKEAQFQALESLIKDQDVRQILDAGFIFMGLYAKAAYQQGLRFHELLNGATLSFHEIMTALNGVGKDFVLRHSEESEPYPVMLTNLMYLNRTKHRRIRSVSRSPIYSVGLKIDQEAAKSKSSPEGTKGSSVTLRYTALESRVGSPLYQFGGLLCQMDGAGACAYAVYPMGKPDLLNPPGFIDAYGLLSVFESRQSPENFRQSVIDAHTKIQALALK